MRKKGFSLVRMTALVACSLLLSFCTSSEFDFENQNADDGVDPKKEVATAKKVNPYAVSIDEAEADLVRMLSSMDKVRTRSVGKERVISSRYASSEKVRTRNSSADEKKIYVFNFEDNQGYAIMSADKRMPSLLALVDSGELKEGDVIDNPGLAHFLMAVSDEYDARMMGENPNPDDDRYPNKKIKHEYGPIFKFPISGYDLSEQPVIKVLNEEFIYHVSNRDEGTCKVRWGQREPYNMLCPIIDGKRAPVGCVATATAQFMSVLKHPTQLPDGTKIDWNKATAQPKIYLNSHRADNYFNIPKLMFELGKEHNLAMNYGSEGSGADMANISRSLVNLGYSNGGYVDYFTVDRAINELKRNKCVVISGYAKYWEEKCKFLGITIKTKIFHDKGHVWLVDGLVEKRKTVDVRKYVKVDKHTGMEIYNGMFGEPDCPYKDGQILVEGKDFEFKLESSEEKVYTYQIFHYNFGWGGFGDGYFYAGCFDTSKRINDLPKGGSLDSDEHDNYVFKAELLLNVNK